VKQAAGSDRRPPCRPAAARGLLAAGLGALLVAGAVVVAFGDRPGQDGPAAVRPLPGVPLRGASGLRLLVADDPTPFVLDVDTGALQPVTGLPTGGDRAVHVESVGEDAVVVSRRDCRGRDCAADSAAYLVRHGGTVATRLGAASDVEAARDGRGVWLLTSQDRTGCVLSQVGLDGRSRRAARPLPCDAVLIDELPSGLLVYRSDGPSSALVTADGGLRPLPQVVDGVAGADLVLSTLERGRQIALTDLRDGTSHRLPWPSRLDDHVMGLIEGHPDGRLASVAFYPARDRAEQTLDLWLLDLTTRRWRQLPDMPLRLAPSKPQASWTADGRLLLLAELPGEPAGLVAVWRPGEPRIAVRRVPFPQPGPPSGLRFAIW
jgi:hypothetical protein